MHIRNGHIQKTQPPHTANKWRGTKSMGDKMINFKIDTTSYEREREPGAYRSGTVSGKIICHWGFKPDF
jgi:hypothetical protein